MKELKLPGWWIKYERIIKAGIMCFLPLLCAMMACAIDGKSIADVYAPASEWNDELFYYKQVESIVQYGIPQGFFGYNESQALKFSFAAWSPVLVIPHIIWGLIFGWNVMSPVYCNIFIMMLAVFVFVYLVKPTWKQLLMLSVMFASFTPVTRFMLSAMPEVICFASLIITLSFVFSYVEEEKLWKIVAMFFMASLMTLMRPYLILFMFFPIFFAVKRNRIKGGIVSLLVFAVTVGAYAWISYYLSAAYFAPLFDTGWIDVFFSEGIIAGIKFFIYKLVDVGIWAMRTVVQGFISGLNYGKQIGAFLLIMLILWAQSFKDFRKKNYNRLQIHLPLAVCYLGMLVAVLVMYKPVYGGRHMLTFTMAGVFVVCIMETKFYRKAILTAGVLAYLFVVMATDAYEHQIPYITQEREADVLKWESVFEKETELNTTDAPGFDNVVIWTMTDEIDGKEVDLQWQMLYAVPSGFGISCCTKEYVEENLSNLKSKYLAVVDGGTIEAQCKENSFREIGRGGGIVIYELR